MKKNNELNNLINNNDLIDPDNLNTYLYKKKSKENFLNYSLKELQLLPVYNGIVNLKFFHNNIRFKMLNIKNDDSVVLKYFWRNCYEPTSLKIWNEINKKNGIYIDVGAHTGIYTLCSLINNPKNIVISIEPSYINYIRLVNNLRINNLPSNDCFNFAASNKDGFTEFENKTTTNFLSQAGKINPKSKNKIKSIVLDNFEFNKTSLAVNCIKIDTEGYEIEVLEGSEKIINQYSPDILIELNERSANKCFSFLKKFNYNYFLIDETDIIVNEISAFDKKMLKNEGVNYIATKKNISEINSILNK